MMQICWTLPMAVVLHFVFLTLKFCLMLSFYALSAQILWRTVKPLLTCCIHSSHNGGHLPS